MRDMIINVPTDINRIEFIYSFGDSATHKRCTYKEVIDKKISTKIHFCCVPNVLRFFLLHPLNAKCIWIVWKIFILLNLRCNTAERYFQTTKATTIEYCCPWFSKDTSKINSVLSSLLSSCTVNYKFETMVLCCNLSHVLKWKSYSKLSVELSNSLNLNRFPHYTYRKHCRTCLML